MLRFTIPFTPVPKERAKPNYKTQHMYTPQRTRNAEMDAGTYVKTQLPKGWKLIYGPVSISVVIYVKVPKAMPKKLWRLAVPVTKPDWDNLGKLLSDCFKNIVWSDDSHVTLGRVQKEYAWDGKPRWDVSLSWEGFEQVGKYWIRSELTSS